MGSTIVMMLTSGDRPEDGPRCAQLGIGAYLLKPIKQSELLEAIDLALGVAHRSQEAASAKRCPRRTGALRILLAEDSLVNQKLAVALLEGEGHQVVIARNGKEAVAAFDAQPFDLILMDVQMPEMDGLEATTRIRAKERRTGTHVPIVAMTARALKGDREKCLASGMDRYVAKPIRAEELFDTIEEIIAGRDESATAGGPEVSENR
jgi:two-component system, sensor histidine kinase and response regulator